MRPWFVIRQLGLLLLLLSAAMIPTAALSLYDYTYICQAGEDDALAAFLTAALLGIFAGLLLYWQGRRYARPLGRREALLLVALAWVVGAALAAMPFRLWAAFHDFVFDEDRAFTSFINCYFEAMSGLTTTGASVLTNIESLPRSLLFWRAFTHWIGGLGIVVLFVAVLPILGVGGKRLFRYEAPGPHKEGVRPRIRAAAQVLWFIYLGITLAEVLALHLAGLGWIDAISHAFATLATGGFSTQNASITGFGSWKIELIIVVFMFMAGVNFGLYDQLLAGRWRSVVKNPELRAYVGIMAAAAIAISLMLIGQEIQTVGKTTHTGFWATIRHVLFTTVSIQTTTGFCTADFNQWAFPAKAILVGLMFVGGCGGSTGGGIKVIRFVILAKVLWMELETVFRPNVVRTVRVGTSTVDAPLRSATLVYFCLIGIVVIVATMAVVWLESPGKIEARCGDPAITAFTAVVATLNNIGPGLDLVGASSNYAWLESPTKILLCLCMVLGRLELYAFLVLIMPGYWREE